MSKRSQMKNMFKKMGIKDKAKAIKDIETYVNYYEKYKKYLLANEDTPVNWNDNTQTRYYACYDYENDVIFSNSATNVKYCGVTYTTNSKAICDFVDIIGKDNFKKYIVGV